MDASLLRLLRDTRRVQLSAGRDRAAPAHASRGHDRARTAHCTVTTTTGTTGTPGLFMLDDRSLKVANALALRMLRAWLVIDDVFKIIAVGARRDGVAATTPQPSPPRACSARTGLIRSPSNARRAARQSAGGKYWWRYKGTTP